MANAKLRTKTGCLTCRKRRVKCGEQKPACHGCASHGRACIWPTERDLYDRRHCTRGGKRPCHASSSSSLPSPEAEAGDASKVAESAEDPEVEDIPLFPVGPSSMSIASRSDSVRSVGSSTAAFTSPSPSFSSTSVFSCRTSTPVDDSPTMSPLHLRSLQPWTEYYRDVELDLVHHFHKHYLPMMLVPTFPRARLFDFGKELASMMIESPGAKMAVLAATASNKFVLSNNPRYQLQAIQYYSQAVRVVNQTVDKLRVDGRQRPRSPDNALLLAVVFLYLYCLWGPYSTEEAQQHVAGAMALLKLRYTDDRAPLRKDRAFHQVTVESVLYQASLLHLHKVRTPASLLDTQFHEHSERFLNASNEPQAKVQPRQPKLPATPDDSESPESQDVAMTVPVVEAPRSTSQTPRSKTSKKNRGSSSKHRTNLLDDSSMVLGAPLELYRLIEELLRLQNAPEQITASALDELKEEVAFWENIAVQFEEAAEDPESPASPASSSSSSSSSPPSSVASSSSSSSLPSFSSSISFPSSASGFYTDAITLHTYVASLLHDQLVEYLASCVSDAPESSPTGQQSSQSASKSSNVRGRHQLTPCWAYATIIVGTDGSLQKRRSAPWQVSRALDLLRKPHTFETWSRSYLGALPITIISHAVISEDDKMLIRNFLTLTGHRTGFGLVQKVGGQLDAAWSSPPGATSTS